MASMRIALLSTSDTDLLSARASGADYVWANPSRPGHQSMAQVIEGADAPTRSARRWPPGPSFWRRRVTRSGRR